MVRASGVEDRMGLSADMRSGSGGGPVGCKHSSISATPSQEVRLAGFALSKQQSV